ncbi:MAG TPA: OmpH family outer membrane protein [Bacteroidales bacterium]|jgi:outer membrane protein|nr:OmpH family outer membrane protein [Bacteroidales bacterium]
MKKIILLAAIFCTMGFGASAQKYAFVNTDYIIDNIPEYTDAQAQLDELSANWQKEIDAKFAEIDKMYKSYQNEAVLLPEDMKKKREEDIIKKEREAKDLQKKRFGKDGDLFKKRQELIKPIQEKIYNAIEDIATAENYAVIFDKATNATLIYTNPKYDVSEQVLEKMGYTYKPQQNTKTKK